MPQYQHYVPQFILRKHADYVRPDRDVYADDRRFERALKKAKNRAGVTVLEFKEGFDKAVLNRRSCSNTFGVPDMYEAKIETALSGLEQRVSKVIEAIENDLSSGKGETVIARPQKDLLRKFIFIMAYRNRKFHRRFRDSEDDYDANDRAELLSYMHDKGIQTPREVWLNTICAFIDVDLQQEVDSWKEWLMNHAYPGDARWFWKNMTTSYLCFCTPKDIDEEFVLTQNAYGIFEGPNSNLGWTDWHTFAPINPRLVIISRNHYLGDVLNVPLNMAKGLAATQRAVIEAMTSRYKDPAEAHSWLEELPVSRPTTSYPTVRYIRGRVPTSHGFTPRDTFTFKFARLPSTFVQRVNSIFLEEAIQTDTIVYKSQSALRKALEAYLELDQVGFKVAIEKPIEPEIWYTGYNTLTSSDEAPECKRQEYLQMLERIARNLGSDCTAKFNLSTLRPVVIIPPFSATFFAKYERLGKKPR